MQGGGGRVPGSGFRGVEGQGSGNRAQGSGELRVRAQGSGFRGVEGQGSEQKVMYRAQGWGEGAKFRVQGFKGGGGGCRCQDQGTYRVQGTYQRRVRVQCSVGLGFRERINVGLGFSAA